MANLRVNMVNAHAAAAEAAMMEQQAAVTAPALFKPEWWERAQGDYDRGMAGMRMWSA